MNRFYRVMKDEEILYAYKCSASTEGICCEPAVVASLACVIKKCNEKFFTTHTHGACTLTGSSPEDPNTVFSVAKELIKADATMKSVKKALERTL